MYYMFMCDYVDSKWIYFVVVHYDGYDNQKTHLNTTFQTKHTRQNSQLGTWSSTGIQRKHKQIKTYKCIFVVSSNLKMKLESYWTD